MLKNSLTKANLINDLSAYTGLSLNLSKKIINDLIEIIIKNIIKGNLNIKNVGSFKLIKKKERVGRNPKNPEVDIQIPERSVVKFRAGKEMKALLSKNSASKLNTSSEPSSE